MSRDELNESNFVLDDLYLLEHCVTLEIKRLYDLQSNTRNLKEFKKIYSEHIRSLEELKIKVSKLKNKVNSEV